ncbi:ribosomal protein S5 domain 2-like protein, partial [Tothia fuscella]
PSTRSHRSVFESSPIFDRQSTFKAFYSPDPARSTAQLLSLPEVQDASHRIFAWRVSSGQMTLTGRHVFESGHDDDGERFAGKKLQHLLENMNVPGTIMVARWYGGVLLGPVRFKHIEDCAKDAIISSELSQPSNKKQRTEEGSTSSTPISTMRPEELQRRKRELIQVLQRRDESIFTLRLLLEHKKSEQRQTPNLVPPISTPSRKVDYGAAQLPRLEALEIARDASIEFLLKEIDRVEAESTKRRVESADK